MSNIDKRALRHSAESIIGILENIAGLEPSDIDGDSVELRFETEDGFDTGCDVSIVDQCQKTADVVLAMLDERERNQQYIKRRDQENEDIALTVGKLRVELEAAEKRIAELEAREVVLPRAHDVHPLGPQSAKIFCEFHRSIVNRCADEIRKVGVKVSIKGN
ncbi:hypothetical protein DM773_16560 [Escherichia coli]|nr:hypothetical protein DM773_16560 [Escherichia coli]